MTHHHKLSPEACRLLEIEAQIEVLEAKLWRKKKPLGWTRRQSAKQRVAELKATRELLKQQQQSS
jgi:hypothetical protein